jgi:hypothetical protein
LAWVFYIVIANIMARKQKLFHWFTSWNSYCKWGEPKVKRIKVKI